jgi:predicted deacylase
LSGLAAAIYTEYPAPGPTDLRCVEAYVAGVKRVLASLGLLDPGAAPAPAKPAIRLVSGGNVDRDMQVAGSTGLFLARVRYGERVRQGQVLGQIVDPRGRVLEDAVAPHDGWIVVMMRRPHVKPGDRLLAVAAADG